MAGGIKVTTADREFGRCVKERVNWSCEHCGTTYERGARGLECSHYFGRANYSVRFDVDNCFAHCTYCHFYLGGNPDDFRMWAVQKLGEGRIDILRDKRNDTNLAKMVKKNLKEVAAHYRAELKRMEGLRADGHIERLEFESWV